MVPILITFMLFTVLILLTCWRGVNKSIIQLAENKRFEISNGKEKSSPKYISTGLGFTLKLLIISFLYTGKNSTSKDTIFDKMYQVFGSPRSKAPYATHIVKFLNFVYVYPTEYKAIKSILCSDICSDRIPKKLTQYYYSGPGKGIIFNSGDEAKELRRYTMKTLGHLGFGRNHRMSEILYEQLTDLIANFENLISSTNNKIQVQNLFTHSAINIVWCIIGGEKFSHNDETLLFLYENVERMANFDLTTAFLALYLPKCVLMFLDNFGYEVQKLFNSIENLDKYFYAYIEEKKERLSEVEPTDFVDYFLLEIEKHRTDDNLNKIYCQEQMSYVLMDLFAAGMDTTSKYMESAFMFLALNPDVQVKIQSEIDSVIGAGAPSFTNHRKRMPFMEATIMEIHRLGNIVPFMPRLTSKDWETDGQHFDKDTFIAANFYFFRMDETYWGDPKIFRPQRFLDSEYNLIVEKLNHVLPFGAGTRGCLGESVATASIFVLLTGILQRYTVIQNDLNEFLGLTKKFVAVSHPEPFHVSLIHRNA